MRNLLDTQSIPRGGVWPEIPWPERMEGAASTVFAALLSRPAAAVSSLKGRSGDLTAVVSLTGAISGALSLCCSSAAAGNFARRMLGVPQPTEEQIHIGLGELAYRIARTLGKEAAGPATASRDRECLVTSPVIAGPASADCDCLAESYLIAFDFQGFSVWIRLSLFDSDF